MRKKKVLSVYGFLALFALGLAAFNVLNFGSLTGKVVAGESYQEELFLGSSYEFKYFPSSFNLDGDMLRIQGQLKELLGTDHDLQVTGYSFSSSGEVLGTTSNEVFLGANSDLSLNINIPTESEPKKIIFYIEDDKTSVRLYKEFDNSQSSLTGNAVNVNFDDGSLGSFFLGFLLFGSFIAFILYKAREHKKSVNFHHVLSNKQQRKYIDLDVR